FPEPSAGDLFFDFEGNPFWDHEGGLEYLWGILDADGEFEPMFASTREEERSTFERFIELVRMRREAHPDMHVYHYAAYEVTALRDAIAAHTREDCIATRLLRDWLLERRQEALDAFGPFPVAEPEEPKPIPERKVERAALREALLEAGDETCALAAQLLDYHD